MKCFSSIIMLILLVFSCKPSFDVHKEIHKIEKFSKSDFLNVTRFKDRIDTFYPERYWQKKDKDSMIKLVDSIYNVLDNQLYYNPDYFSNHKVVINKSSDVIKAGNYFFVLLSINETFDIKKGFDVIILNEIKNYLDNNLITNIEGENKILVNVNSDLIGIYNKKNDNWNYFNFNSRMLLEAYGMDISKKLLNIYFTDVFISPKTPFNIVDFKEFRELYSEIEDSKQFQNLNFDDYCKCIYNYHRKTLEIEGIPPDEYYESENQLENIYRCRILTTKD